MIWYNTGEGGGGFGRLGRKSRKKNDDAEKMRNVIVGEKERHGE